MRQPVSYLKFDFSSTHILSKEEWSDAKNSAEFGKCANLNGHGHNFQLLAGFTLPTLSELTFTGRGTINRVVDQYLHAHLDMKSLNSYLKGEANFLPTCENILLKLQVDLENLFREIDVQLISLELTETRNNSVKITT